MEKRNTEFIEKKLAWLAISALSLTLLVALLGAGMLYVLNNPEQFQQKEPLVEESSPTEAGEIKDGRDVATGFIAEGDYQLVKARCISCHSSKLVLQNRATRDGWEEMIRWMQETQKLQDLGEDEDKILDYLASYYAPEEEGRRKNLTVEEWYVIE